MAKRKSSGAKSGAARKETARKETARKETAGKAPAGKDTAGKAAKPAARKDAARKDPAPKEPQARFRPEGLETAGGILADLNKRQSPAKILLGRMSARDLEAEPEDVLAPREEASPGPVAPAAAEPLDSLLDAVARDGLQPKGEASVDAEPAVDAYAERAARIPLEIYVKVVKGDRVVRALTRDISATGMFLAAMALPVLQAGDQVLLELTLPGAEEPIWAQGQVVREASAKGFHQTGIRFTHLAERDDRAIREYVEARARFLED